MSGPAMTARIVEAAARAYCHADGECPCATPGDCVFWGSVAGDMRAALAAAVREAGMDRDELVAAARETAAEAEREMLLDIGDHALTGKTAALLRALAEIADAG
jgi:hypothetical protein